MPENSFYTKVVAEFSNCIVEINIGIKNFITLETIITFLIRYFILSKIQHLLMSH